jgi:peptidoglycan/xylan/chitin deacetylase (PgdA/CDA1 family)
VNLKAIFLSAAHNAGLNTLVHACWPSRLTILCYHGVLPKALQPYDHGVYTTVSASGFRQQLEWIGRHFNVVSCSQIRELYMDGRPLPPRALLITFDDGYWNNLALAAPILREYGFPATFFISTGYIGSRELFWYDDLPRRIMNWPGHVIQRPGGGDSLPLPPDPRERRIMCQQLGAACKRVPDAVRRAYLEYIRQGTADQELPFDMDLYRILTWDEVRDLARQGFEVGSHTSTHPILARLDEDGIRTELESSRARIQTELNTSCYALAYPNGTVADYDARVLRCTQTAGFDLAFTMADRPYGATEDRYTISRLPVPGHVPLAAFTFSVSGTRALARKMAHA